MWRQYGAPKNWKAITLIFYKGSEDFLHLEYTYFDQIRKLVSTFQNLEAIRQLK
jgi:hypothetical protein